MGGDAAAGVGAPGRCGAAVARGAPAGRRRDLELKYRKSTVHANRSLSAHPFCTNIGTPRWLTASSTGPPPPPPGWASTLARRVSGPVDGAFAAAGSGRGGRGRRGAGRRARGRTASPRDCRPVARRRRERRRRARGRASIADWSSCDECQTYRMYASVRGAATASATLPPPPPPSAAAAQRARCAARPRACERRPPRGSPAGAVERRRARAHIRRIGRERRRRAQVVGRRLLGIDVARLDGAPRFHPPPRVPHRSERGLAAVARRRLVGERERAFGILPASLQRVIERQIDEPRRLRAAVGVARHVRFES